MNEPSNLSQDLLSFFRTRLEKIFKRSLVTQKDKKQQRTRVRLSDTLLACFATLSPQSRDEELEDLVYFILDLYQFHGVPVATSEVDVTQVVVDLRTALEELHAKIKSPPTKATSRNRSTAKAKPKPVAEEPPNSDHHTFLILDKNVQGFPWESIPVLRGRSVSRIPNLEFLLDRIQWARWQRGLKLDVSKSENPTTKGETEKVDRVIVDPRKTYYLLNPSGDLKGTEGRFSAWLDEMKAVGWDGVVGHAPSEQQITDALTRNDLFM